MSGATVPYSLRPHKAVDRRLFIDLLTRLERWRPLQDHAYVSMGAYALEDHKLIHRAMGLKRLIAFDMDEDVVRRQIFNRPIDSCRCLVRTAHQIVSDLERALADGGAADAAGVIAWLDYTEAQSIRAQITEFQSLIQACAPGDVVRVTVNAHPRDLNVHIPDGQPLKTIEEIQEKHFQSLASRIGEFLPSSAKAADLTTNGYPLIISHAFAAAASDALPSSGDRQFFPLSIVRYADGAQMLSITGIVSDRATISTIHERIGIDSWAFASKDWTEIHQLVVPALTLRERLYLERGVATETNEEIVSDLGFDVAGKSVIGDVLSSYRNYYRFYPTLLAAEV